MCETVLNFPREPKNNKKWQKKVLKRMVYCSKGVFIFIIALILITTSPSASRLTTEEKQQPRKRSSRSSRELLSSSFKLRIENKHVSERPSMIKDIFHAYHESSVSSSKIDKEERLDFIEGQLLSLMIPSSNQNNKKESVITEHQKHFTNIILPLLFDNENYRLNSEQLISNEIDSRINERNMMYRSLGSDKKDKDKDSSYSNGRSYSDDYYHHEYSPYPYSPSEDHFSIDINNGKNLGFILTSLISLVLQLIVFVIPILVLQLIIGVGVIILDYVNDLLLVIFNKELPNEGVFNIVKDYLEVVGFRVDELLSAVDFMPTESESESYDYYDGYHQYPPGYYHQYDDDDGKYRYDDDDDYEDPHYSRDYHYNSYDDDRRVSYYGHNSGSNIGNSNNLKPVDEGKNKNNNKKKDKNKKLRRRKLSSTTTTTTTTSDTTVNVRQLIQSLSDSIQDLANLEDDIPPQLQTKEQKERLHKMISLLNDVEENKELQDLFTLLDKEQQQQQGDEIEVSKEDQQLYTILMSSVYGYIVGEADENVAAQYAMNAHAALGFHQYHPDEGRVRR